MKLLLAVGLLLAVVEGAKPIEMRVSYRNAHAPKEVKAIIWVEQHPDNRVLVVTLDGPAFLRKFEQLDGEKAPRVREVVFNRVPAGHYVLHAGVYDGREKARGVATADICRAGMDVSCAGDH